MTDAISRRRVLKALEAEKRRLIDQKDEGWPFTGKILAGAVDTVHEFIKELPALDVELLDRLGDFGKLFMDYRGCPRGPMGRMGGMPIEEEVLYMKPITDVDGGRWIPVNADALHELVSEYKRRAPVVHARWIPITLYGREHAIKCSACNNCDNPSKVPGRHCWQCGARMDGEIDA